MEWLGMTSGSIQVKQPPENKILRMRFACLEFRFFSPIKGQGQGQRTSSSTTVGLVTKNEPARGL